jgi:hypothetical protein
MNSRLTRCLNRATGPACAALLAAFMATAPSVGLAGVPERCSAAKLAEVLAPATSPGTAGSYKAEKQFIDCQLTLPPNAVVTRPLVFLGAAASNVTLDCNGGTLDGRHYPASTAYRAVEVRSKVLVAPVQHQEFGQWSPPVNVTVQNCRILGSIRLVGMSENATGDAILWSSRGAGHVERVRRAAPSRITFRNVVVEGRGGNVIYFSAGVNHSKIIDSKITGNIRAGALYMDAESHKNVVRDTHFKRDIPRGADGYPEGERELISVDGSSHNLIANNVFEGLAKGGVFLYRNCGEKSVIRHSTPSHNDIVNNVFLYSSEARESFDPKKPAIFIGSRDGKDWSPNWDCSDDGGYPFGSSASDQDMASHNAAVQNHVAWQSASQAIRVGNAHGENNHLALNHGNLNASGAHANQRANAGCVVRNGVNAKFVLNGTSISSILAVSASDAALGASASPRETRLHSTRLVCTDSELRPQLTPSGMASIL